MPSGGVGHGLPIRPFTEAAARSVDGQHPVADRDRGAARWEVPSDGRNAQTDRATAGVSGKRSSRKHSRSRSSTPTRTVMPVFGHLLNLDLKQPTKGVDIELDYSDCGIEYVHVVDFHRQ